VTVIGWVKIFGGAIGLLALPLQTWSLFHHGAPAFSIQSPGPARILTLGVVDQIVALGCGIGILRGINAARWVYVVWKTFNFLHLQDIGTDIPLPLGHSGMPRLTDLHRLLVFAIPIVFLFLPRANRYFTKTENGIAEESYDSGTVIQFILGGFLFVASFSLDYMLFASVLKIATTNVWTELAVALGIILPFVGIAMILSALGRTGYRNWPRDVTVLLALLALAMGSIIKPLYKFHNANQDVGIDSRSFTPEGRYDRAEEKLKDAESEERRFNALGRAAKAAFDAGNYDEAKADAVELEGLTPKYVGQWNYGNAIQDANVVLGRLALKDGNIAEAKDRLLAAGHRGEKEGKAVQEVVAEAISTLLFRLEDPAVPIQSCIPHDYWVARKRIGKIGVNPRLNSVEGDLARLKALLKTSRVASIEVALIQYLKSSSKRQARWKDFQGFFAPRIQEPPPFEFSFSDSSLIRLPDQNPVMPKRLVISGHILAFALCLGHTWRFCRWIVRRAVSESQVLATAEAVEHAHQVLANQEEREVEKRFLALFKCMEVSALHARDYRQATWLHQSSNKGINLSEARTIALSQRLVGRKGVVLTTSEMEARTFKAIGVNYWTPPLKEDDYKIIERPMPIAWIKKRAISHR